MKHNLLLCIILSSCILNPQLKTARTHKNIQGGEEDSPPLDLPPLSYFQSGNTKSTGTFPLPTSATVELQLKGQNVDSFIQIKEQSQCLVIPFEQIPPQGKVLLLKSIPQSRFDFSQNTREYFYRLGPNDSISNQSFCGNSAMITKLANLYPQKTIAYSIQEICPDCPSNQLRSSPIGLFSPDGMPWKDKLDLNHLNIKLISPPAREPSFECQDDSSCKSEGFDCCSSGVCARDKKIKSTTDISSPEFIHALAQIEQNPLNIYNYPQFFHLCSTSTPPPPPPVPPDTSRETAEERFLKLKHLYQCTTPIEGEMSLCTKTFENVSPKMPQSFLTSPDDRSFRSTYTGPKSMLPKHSLHKVIFGGETLFENQRIIKGITVGTGGQGLGNDNLTEELLININYKPKAQNPDLFITYKVDGSCEQIGHGLGRCYKEYIQGQELGKVNDHFPASNSFLLPYYANLQRPVKVEVDGVLQSNGHHYTIHNSPPRSFIEFKGTELAVFDGQKVKIIYYASLTNYPNLMSNKLSAVAEIQKFCGSTIKGTRLKPKLDKNNHIVDYICDYPPPNLPEPPLQQVVMLSAKSVPLRYYDHKGVYHPDPNTSAPTQEGKPFFYHNNDLLKPNNVNNPSGFQEIYGSFSKINGAKPAREVRVKRGRVYNIFVDQGTFTPCFQCGVDYHSHLARIFPENFKNKGAGYRPDPIETNSLKTTTYRKDDLLFGRACWLPLTMIPWSHHPQKDTQKQRLKRLQAQHFLFANGYQRDWFGFDYGALIGSWNGTTWFAIGNQRRIKAKSNVLFLAINAYFGDLTNPSNFRITVQEASNIIHSGSQVDTDAKSDGALCRKYHHCETDQDCITQLGWEYACESVTTLASKWPVFNLNGIEIPLSEKSVRLSREFGINGIKRCVYRGRGSPCEIEYDNTLNPESNYSQTARRGLHHCSFNNYCQSFEKGNHVIRFNTKINRYGKSLKHLKDIFGEETDTLGLHTKILGRPYDWIGTWPIPSTNHSSFTYNNLKALCLPGRSPSNNTLKDAHQALPPDEFNGDKINNIGMTPNISPGDHFLSSCSILDKKGNYIYKNTNATTSLNHNDIKNLAASQAISTSALAVFGEIETSPLKNFETDTIDQLAYQPNRCLRGPGSPCFSNLDCAPNSFISSLVQAIDIDDPTLVGIINPYELQFWQESLMCSGPEEEDTSRDLKTNRCCREVSKSLTIGTAIDAPYSDFSTDVIPGISIAIGDSKRYHRTGTVWDLVKDPVSSPNYPILLIPSPDNCTGATCPTASDTEYQFNTFSATAEKTCCSEHWVREFHADENGGGHAWSPDRLQHIPKESFRCLNWLPCDTDTCGGDPAEGYFSCDHTEEPEDPFCLAKATTLSESKNYFNFFASLELTGIGSVYIKTDEWNDLYCSVDPMISHRTVQAPPLILSNPPLPELPKQGKAAPEKLSIPQEIEKTLTKTISKWSFHQIPLPVASRPAPEFPPIPLLKNAAPDLLTGEAVAANCPTIPI